MKLRNVITAAVGTLALLPMAVPAFAGWSVTLFDRPEGLTGLGMWGIDGGQFVGTAYIDGMNYQEAILWDTSSHSYVNLNPQGSYSSCAYGVSGGKQVGCLYSGPWDESDPHAAMWSGTAASCVDINPIGYTGSDAFGITGSQVVGSAYNANGNHAGIWSDGTASSFIDIHPEGYSSSYAISAADGFQVGDAYVNNPYSRVHAGLWQGSSESFVDLNPVGYDSSEAWAVGGGHEAGMVNFYGQYKTGWRELQHAALWSGSASSFVDLNPLGYVESYVNGVSGNYQVGTAWTDNGWYDEDDHAALWCGSADSFVDLHQFLPNGFTYSYASGVEAVGNEIWVAGSANGRPALWHYAPVPEPSSLLPLLGGVIGLGGLIRKRRK